VKPLDSESLLPACILVFLRWPAGKTKLMIYFSQLSGRNDEVTGWKTEELGFDSGQGKRHFSSLGRPDQGERVT
jgi:hypothetical protein